MNFKVRAVVLKEKKYLENQKYLNILTAKNGVLNVKLQLHGQITKNVFSNVYVAGFYEFNLFNGKFGIVVDCVEEIETFFNLRFKPERFVLSQYFCELSYILNSSCEKTSKQLNLLLNSIWILNEKEKFSCDFVKSVFELKLLSYSGYMPNLVCCKFCCNYEKNEMFFDAFHGILICKDCLKNVNNKTYIFKLTKAVLYAMRFIIYKEDKDIFKFKLEKKHLKIFCNIIENIVLIFIERKPLTLKIYKQFKEEINLN